MIHITEKKLVAAIQIALVGECENADRTEAKLLHDIKALSIANVSNQRELLIDLLDKLEKGGSNRFVSKEWIVDNYLQGN
jgi:hypothetical protein